MSAQTAIKTISATVTCTGCGKVHQLVGCYQSAAFSVEQCRHCHHAYTGKKATQTTGESEKFNKKYKMQDMGSLFG